MTARLWCSALLLAMSACGEPASSTPPTTPKTRPADRTEVTMEVSSGVLPQQAPPGSATPSASASATPAAKEASSPEDTIGGPQEPAVEKAVAPQRPRIRACYNKALAADPGVAGSATFDATIGKDGKVGSARFVKREGLNEDVVGCLLVAIKAMTFETGKKSQIVTLSFGATPPAASAGDAGAAKH